MLLISSRPKDRLIHFFFVTLIIISLIPLIIGCASFLRPLNVVYGSYTIIASDDHNFDSQGDIVDSNDLLDVNTPAPVPIVTYPGSVDTPTQTPILVTATLVPMISPNGAAADVAYKNTGDNTTYGNTTAAPPESGSTGSTSVLIFANLMLPLIASGILLFGKFGNRGN